MRLSLLSTFALACCVTIAFPAHAQDEKLKMLLDRSPSPPNAMGYVNAGALAALMEDAGMRRNTAENVDEFWFIADLDVGKMRPDWEAGYATLKDAVTPKQLADKLGGYVDTIAGNEVVWSPQQTYLMPAEENRLGVLRPADRSLLTKWINGSRNFNQADYLRSQAQPPEKFLSFMLAVELQGQFSPVPMAKKFENLKSLKAQKPETVASILASIDGVSVLIGRRGLNECIVRASFSKSPASLKPIAADLLAELMERGGNAAPEVRTWEASTKDNTLSLQGPITEATLSGLLGVFSLQQKAGQFSRDTADSSSRTKEQQAAYRSKGYFDDVNAIVERTRAHKSQTTGALAKWNDARARQIDELGTLNVDPQMVQYGTDVAELLRGNALAVRQGNITAGKTKASQSLSSGYYDNGYGYGYDYNSTTDYQRVTDAYARGNAYANYKDALNQIDKMTASVRRDMTDKFQMQF